jgi:hypothetical protein
MLKTEDFLLLKFFHSALLTMRTNNADTWARLQKMEECFEVKEFIAPEGLE